MSAPILSDAAYAIRVMMSRPWFTFIIIITLAIGIGAVTAMFGTINAALLSNLPFDEPDRLVMGRRTTDGRIGPMVSGYDYFDYREQSQSFESLAALSAFTMRFTVTGEHDPDRVEGPLVTWDLFHTLGVSPVAGRLFTAEEAAEGRADVVLISYGYWQRRFGGSMDALGRTLTVDGRPNTIVGVMPAGFHFVHNVDVWGLTYKDGPFADARRFHNLLLVGRLKPGVAIEQAQAEVDAISLRLQEEYADTNEGKALLLTGLHETLVENVRTSLLLLMGAVVLVLLLACGNVAGLLLARGQVRLTEVAVRSAMGASRPRLVRQLLTESVLTALVAGLAGIALAFMFQGLLVRLLPMGRLGITELGIDMPVLLFALALSIATGVFFGVVPALRGTLVDVTQQLKAGTRSTEARGSSRLRSALVVLQVAVSIVLLIGAGLLIRSLAHQMNVNLGFDPENVLAAEIRLPEGDYPEPQQRVHFFTSLVEEVGVLPGVTSVGLINRLPIRESGGDTYVYPVGRPPETNRDARSAFFRNVLPGYLQTMRIPLLAGRDIAETDGPESPRVMIISKALADLYYPGQNPVGEKMIVDLGEEVEHEVIGVAGDARLYSITGQTFYTMYMSYRQVPQSLMRIAVRTSGDPTALVGPVREILREKDRNIPLAEPAAMTFIINDTLSDYRVITLSLGILSAIALLLAVVGLYSVLAYHVSQRYHELGLRMALGASGSSLIKLILVRGFVLVGIGLVLGIAGSVGATRLLQQFLYETEPTDPVTFVGVSLFLGLVTLLACFLPAWRASRVSPVDALRAE
jgi:putative ABC transport system permease protein